MSPEESMEARLVRVEERLRSTEETVRVFAPTGAQIAGMSADVRALREDFAEFRADRDRERREAREFVQGIERKLENEILACSTANGELRKLWEQESEEREAERKLDKKDRKTFLRNLLLAFVGGMFTILAVVAAALLNAG